MISRINKFHEAYHGQCLVFSTIKFQDTYLGDDLYRVVVSESKLGPTRLNWGLWIYFGVKMLL